MATTEQFSLRWNNFHSNLTSGFHELLEGADMVDVTLAVEGHFLQAHKIVLSICSPYFKQMFRVNPCKHPIVILKDVSHENMKDILEFMYMGEVSVLRDNLTQFLRTAELLQVKGLTGDDTNEETSSVKDVKPDCDNEETEAYNHLLETDMELPRYSQFSSAQVSSSHSSKRKSTNGSIHLKRPKTEQYYQPQPQMPVDKQDLEPVKPKIENNGNDVPETDASATCTNKSSSEIEETKDVNLKGGWENNLPIATSADCNSSDQDLCGSDNKGHVFCPFCYRKFVNRYNLKVHVRDKHEDNSIDLDCHVCGKTMRNQSCLRVHMYHHRKQMLEAAGIL